MSKLFCNACHTLNQDIGQDASELSCGACGEKMLVRVKDQRLTLGDKLVGVILTSCLVGACIIELFSWVWSSAWDQVLSLPSLSAWRTAYLRPVESNAKKQPLQELHLNLLGKIFLTGVAAWLVGKATNMKIRGSMDECQTVADAMVASRRFQDELDRPGATVESVMEKLDVKHMTASKFEAVFGIPFPI